MSFSTATTDLAPVAGRSVSSAWVYALVVLIAAGTTGFHLSGPLGPDVSWLITVSERILAGGRLYIDILEPNPPMAGYLYMPPVLLAHVLGVAPEPLVVFYTVGFGLLMTGISARLIATAGLLKRPELVWPVTLLLFMSGWGEDFAQREHFAAMASLPLLVALALRADGRRPGLPLALLAGLCGGFMLAIKPHFALAILLPALYAVVRRRSLKPMLLAPELWLAGVLFLGFLGLIVVAYPAFLTNILPVASTVYIPDRRDLVTLLLQPPALLFEAVTLLGLIGYRRQLLQTPLLGVFFAAAAGFALSYLAQGKGYAYQLLPGVALMASFVLLGFTQQADGRRPLLQAVAPIVAAAVLAIVPMLNDAALWRARQPLFEALAPYGPGLRIANITPDLTATSPLHRLLHAELINSPPGLLMAICALRLRWEQHPQGEWLAKIDAFEAAERQQLSRDLAARPPDLIVSTKDGFDWIEWADKDPAIAAFLSSYEDIGEVPFDGYLLRLMKRKGLEPKA